MENFNSTLYKSSIKWEAAEKKTKAASNCVVVIPVYKNIDKLSLFEISSIANTIKTLKNYEILLLCSKIFDVEEYNKKFNYDFSYIKVSDGYFQSRKSYSDLCERWEFYDLFSEYEYMFICQPDAWVFEDRLEHFISLGYDYIGAIHMLSSRGTGGQVGNGGFSLRKVAKFKEVCKKTDFSKYRYSVYEDCVFTIKLKKEFNIAPIEVGYEFGWQEHPEAAIKITGGKRPFGCHNPLKNNWNFWSSYIGVEDKKITPEMLNPPYQFDDITPENKYQKKLNLIPKKIIKPKRLFTLFK